MQSKELRQKNITDLTEMLSERRKSLWHFRFGVTGSKVRNVKEGKTVRRDIAKIITIMKEKESKKS